MANEGTEKPTGWSGFARFTLDDLAVLQPGLTVLMPLVGQRYWKLYYAAKAGSWDMTLYQAQQVRELMETAMITRPEYAKDLEAFLEGYLEPIEEAIEEKDWEAFEEAYNAARPRHPARSENWPALRWFDFLKRVFRSQPVVVRGALGFGLKPVAQAMHSHGLVATQWGSGPVDGLGAMIGAWWSYDEASKKHVRVKDIDLMQEIQRYNEVDCKVMMEIVRHLRRSR